MKGDSGVVLTIHPAPILQCAVLGCDYYTKQYETSYVPSKCTKVLSI